MKITNGKLAALIIALVIVIDQALKIWVKTHFYYGEEVQITSWFRLLFIENNGMAFGMELGSKLLLTMFRIIASGAFIYYLWRLRNRTDIPKGYIACIVVTREFRRNSRKTTWLPRHRKMKPFPATAPQEKIGRAHV